MNTGETDQSTEQDLFSLAGQPFDELLEAFKASPEHGPHESVPDRAEQIAGLILAETVGLIRRGSRYEIAHASAELGSMAIVPEEDRSGGHANQEGARLLEAAAVVLGAAGLRSYGFETNMLQKRNGEWPAATIMLSTLIGLAKDDEGDGTFHLVPQSEFKQELERRGKEFDGRAWIDVRGQGLVSVTRDWSVSSSLLYLPRKKKIERVYVKQFLDTYEREQEQASNI